MELFSLFIDSVVIGRIKYFSAEASVNLWVPDSPVSEEDPKLTAAFTFFYPSEYLLSPYSLYDPDEKDNYADMSNLPLFSRATCAALAATT